MLACGLQLWSSVRTYFTPDTVRVLRNPMQGWVMYLGRTWDDNFWTEKGYDSMVTSEGDTVRVSDYASCAYIRTSWASFEPNEGEYAWNNPDSRIMRLINSVRKRGLRMAFRIVVDGRDQGQNTPQYVFDAGAKGYTDPKNPGKNLSPYPDDPIFQEKFSKFLRAFAQRFDNPEDIEFIDAYSLGKWGESHSMIYQDNANKQKVFDWIVELSTDAFRRVPILIHYHRMLGDPADDGWGAVPAEAEKMIEHAVNAGYSLRHDAFGMNGYYQDWEKVQAQKWNFQRPIIMEGGWITGAHHKYWRDPSGKYREGHAEDVRAGEFEAAAQARVNMMDFRINDETRSWFEDAFPLVKKFVAHGGYRLLPSSAVAPQNATAGKSVTVTTSWNNLGWGYFPGNIPQWEGKYRLAIALLDKNNSPVRVVTEPSADPSKWLYGETHSYTTPISLRGLPPGEYQWGVGIVDTQNNNNPAIELSVKEPTCSGWLPLNKIKIQ